MSASPVPTHRIQSNYTVAGLTHRFSVRLNALFTGSQYNTVARSGSTGVRWDLAMDALWTAIKASMDSANTTFGQSTLEEFVSGSYVPLASYNTAVTPTGSGIYVLSSQHTFFFRGTTHSIFKLVLIERFYPGYPRQTAYASLDAADKTLVDAFVNPDSSGLNPNAWAQSFKGDYVNNWSSFTYMLNRRERRRRGIL